MNKQAQIFLNHLEILDDKTKRQLIADIKQYLRVSEYYDYKRDTRISYISDLIINQFNFKRGLCDDIAILILNKEIEL